MRRIQFKPERFATRGGGERLIAVLVQGNVFERDHIRRSLARLGELELADLGLRVRFQTAVWWPE